MVKAAASGKLNKPADEVWALVGPFGNLGKFDGSVTKCTLEDGGVQRRLDIIDSGQIVERLLNYDNEGRTYHWKIVDIIDVPMPIINYRATISVADDAPGKSCVFTMGATFDPGPGATEKEVEELMAADFGTVLENLQKMFGA
jgi:hypothetical protein